VLGNWELNDAGATPALVTLRLQQAAEAAGSADTADTEEAS
jgi:malonate decarboxylase delta subunit